MNINKSDFNYIPIRLDNQYGHPRFVLINKNNIINIDIELDFILGEMQSRGEEPFLLIVTIKTLDQNPIIKKMKKEEFLEFAQRFKCGEDPQNPFLEVLDFYEKKILIPAIDNFISMR